AGIGRLHIEDDDSLVHRTPLFLKRQAVSTKIAPIRMDRGVVCVTGRKSIELSLVLAGSFGLLLPLQAGTHIMLSLLDLLNNASLGAAALKALQCGLQRFIFLYVNFRH